MRIRTPRLLPMLRSTLVRSLVLRRAVTARRRAFQASLLAALLFTPALAAAQVKLPLGQPAPDFELADQDGARHRLSDLRGRIVVLEWTSPRCPYVKRHAQAQTARRLVGQHGPAGVIWLAIDSSHFNTPEESRAWRAQQGLPFPILQDPQGEVGRRYGARTTPHLYVLDRDGALRYQGAIDDDAWGGGDPIRGFVGEALEALLAGRPVAVPETEPYGCSVKYRPAAKS